MFYLPTMLAKYIISKPYKKIIGEILTGTTLHCQYTTKKLVKDSFFGEKKITFLTWLTIKCCRFQMDTCIINSYSGFNSFSLKQPTSFKHLL